MQHVSHVLLNRFSTDLHVTAGENVPVQTAVIASYRTVRIGASEAPFSSWIQGLAETDNVPNFLRSCVCCGNTFAEDTRVYEVQYNRR